MTTTQSDAEFDRYQDRTDPQRPWTLRKSPERLAREAAEQVAREARFARHMTEPWVLVTVKDGDRVVAESPHPDMAAACRFLSTIDRDAEDEGLDPDDLDVTFTPIPNPLVVAS